jgi:hypothetical protein
MLILPLHAHYQADTYNRSRQDLPHRSPNVRCRLR